MFTYISICLPLVNIKKKQQKQNDIQKHFKNLPKDLVLTTSP